ncbi:MAG: hypothetical protein JSW71_02800 [Gemmatimonadota bacterium]|nr:MAG: hypothetical protein JSW71_02800 [Gemmatimonadota bacterium]
MNGKPVRPRGLSILLSCAFVLATGCTGRGTSVQSVDALRLPSDSAGPGAVSRAAQSIRFAIELSGDASGPLYVLLNEEDDQPGWVKVFRDGDRIYLRERCEIEDCGVPAAVCGAAVPLISDVAHGRIPKGIEFGWDGLTSVLDSVSGCETRQPVSPGDYIARFCFSRAAEFEAESDPVAVPGKLIDPTCVERPFTLREPQVVLRITPKEP